MNTITKLSLAGLLAVAINSTAFAGAPDNNPPPTRDAQGEIGKEGSLRTSNKTGGKFGRSVGKAEKKSGNQKPNQPARPARQRSQGNEKG